MLGHASKRNAELVRLLQGLRDDPTLVVQLNESLFFARFCVLAAKPAPIEQLSLLTYQSHDGITELPVFTSPDRAACRKMVAQSGATPVEVEGIALWPRLLEITKTGNCEAAIDVGEPHGIRFPFSMILTMVRLHGDNVQLPEGI
jgi:hypothetical protein